MNNSLWPHVLYRLWNSPGQNTGVGSLFLLQGIFPTQGSNSGLLHCRQILYQLSHKGSSRILKWVAYPFFLTQESIRGLLHWRQILYQLSYQGCSQSKVSVQFSHSVMSGSLRPHGLQHTRPPCLSPTPRVYPNSCPWSQWCHPTISPSVNVKYNSPDIEPMSNEYGM